MSNVIYKLKKYRGRQDMNKKNYFYYSGQPQRDGKANNRTYMEYITRPEALFNLDITSEEANQLEKLKNTNHEKYDLLISKYQKRPKMTGIWTKDGLASQKRLDSINESLLNIDTKKQLVWDGVISLKTAFADKYDLHHPEKFYEVVKDRINDLLTYKGLNPDKVEWFFAMHKNTNNPHVHLAFFEKEPRYNNQYTSWYNIPDEPVLDKFKENLEFDFILKHQNHQMKALEMDNGRNYLVNFFKLNFKSEDNNIIKKSNWTDVVETYNEISTNYSSILDSVNEEIKKVSTTYNQERNRVFYNDLPKATKAKIDAITEYVIANEPELTEVFKNYVENVNTYQTAINEHNNKDDNRFAWSKLHGPDGLYARLGQKVLDSASRKNYHSGILLPQNVSHIKKAAREQGDTLKWKFIKLMRRLDNYIVRAKKLIGGKQNDK